MIKTYSEVIALDNFEDRYEYLRMKGFVGDTTFGGDRWLNQILYKSGKWRRVRDTVIIRDSGFDLAMDGYNVVDYAIIHHINPITLEDVKNDNPCIYDLENLICTSHDTHNAIHFGSGIQHKQLVTRSKNDTSPWLKNKRG